ncbi:MAG TPA: phytanoyl-CoA dioxygenase family protein [Capsulimonadaceae bacterium]|jgi:ectoine hydroxylase-related dioxygenase (phytanoyl-CoA dioxygenase family)
MSTFTNAAVAEAAATYGGSLSQAQRDAYSVEGYIVLPDLLTEDDMAGVKAAMTEKVSEMAADLIAAGKITDPLIDEPFPSRLARLFEHLSEQDFLAYGRGWRERRPGYFDLMSNPKILDAVESLIGPEIYANPVYNTRPKVPGVAAGAVPWHQDKSYWPDANSNPVITVWIPFVETSLENGCLHIWPRTHKKRMLSHHKETHTGTSYTELDANHVERAVAVPLPVSAGTAILFNDRCVHMSTPNNSRNVRWSVDLRYQPTDQDPMPQHGIGFLARSQRFPDRIATLEDWLAYREEHGG